MKLSYSLKKNIFEVTVGGLLNKLHLHKRRDTLIFADIFVNYIKECEDAGHAEEMKEIAQKWMILYFKTLVPPILRRIPPLIFLNKIMRRVWVNLGLMEDVNFAKKDNIIEINTENEGITKVIGKNEFSVGLFIGVINMVFDSGVETIDVHQAKEKCKYTFKIKNEKRPDFNSKERTIHDKLNYLPPIKGFTLKDVFEKGIFQLKEKNRIYFRGRYLYPVENTVFHLLSNEKILLNDVAEISYNYFKEIVKESSDREKLVLLKTLLQTMGWGIITIVSKENEIVLEIKNPPYGMQAEKDNWGFLIRIILGYLWLIDKKLKIKNIIEKQKDMIVNFSSS